MWYIVGSRSFSYLIILLFAVDELLFTLLVFPGSAQKKGSVKKSEEIKPCEQVLGSSVYADKDNRGKSHAVQGNAIEVFGFV